MKIIDCHTHPIFNDSLLKKTALENKIDFSYKGLLNEMKENRVERILAISSLFRENKLIAELASKNKNILPVAYVSPIFIRRLKFVEKQLKENNFKAVKLYPGYEHFYPNERKCEPIYRMAERLGIPVIFHSGSVWPKIKGARIKFARPIHIDDIAVNHPDMKILMAHSGNPSITDAVDVAYKNKNVFLDVSGWFEGRIDKNYAKIARANLQFLLAWTGSEKILYGTDWPLIRMRLYINFVKSVGISKADLKKIMYKNALRLFWKC